MLYIEYVPRSHYNFEVIIQQRKWRAGKKAKELAKISCRGEKLGKSGGKRGKSGEKAVPSEMDG